MKTKRTSVPASDRNAVNRLIVIGVVVHDEALNMTCHWFRWESIVSCKLPKESIYSM
jgi:hypothetical protein